MSYIFSIPKTPSYLLRGLSAYSLFSNKSLNVDYINVVTGHDTFHISRRVTRLYYVLSGNGSFIIGGTRYRVNQAELVAIPPKVEYSYSGQMTHLMMGSPGWTRGNDIVTRWNQEVESGGTLPPEVRRPWLNRLVGTEILGISALRVTRAVWRRLSSRIRKLAALAAAFLVK